jgi:hypothetical protein
MRTESEIAKENVKDYKKEQLKGGKNDENKTRDR